MQAKDRAVKVILDRMKARKIKVGDLAKNGIPRTTFYGIVKAGRDPHLETMILFHKVLRFRKQDINFIFGLKGASQPFPK